MSNKTKKAYYPEASVYFDRIVCNKYLGSMEIS